MQQAINLRSFKDLNRLPRTFQARRFCSRYRGCLIVGSLRRDDGWAWEQQEEVVHTNARLPSNFIHPLSLGGNWKPTLVSSYRNVMFFLFRNVVLLTFARFIATVFFILQRNSFFGFHLSKKYKQNLVNRLSNSSAHVGGLLPQKTSVPCARVRNDRNWREKRGSLPSLPTALSAVAEQTFVLL